MRNTRFGYRNQNGDGYKPERIRSTYRACSAKAGNSSFLFDVTALEAESISTQEKGKCFFPS